MLVGEHTSLGSLNVGALRKGPLSVDGTRDSHVPSVVKRLTVEETLLVGHTSKHLHNSSQKTDPATRCDLHYGSAIVEVLEESS